MNVLMVIGDMDRGGVQTHVYELSKNIVFLGNSVTVMSRGGRLVDGLLREGVEHIVLPLDSKDLYSMFKCVRTIKKYVKERRIDIVHAHTRQAAFLASIACESTGVPFVTTVHANYRPNAILDRMSRWGRGQIAVSYDLVRYLLLNGRNVFSENIHVIPNGIDTDRFSPRQTVGDSKKIVFASRMDSDCSLAALALIDIAEDLHSRYPDLEIVLCGDGDMSDEIRIMAERVNIRIEKAVIKVLGYVDSMETVLRGACAFVGVSRAALEAMSCGVPVILAGNEGYIGRVTKENLSLCESTNFCCRGAGRITVEGFKNDVACLLSLSAARREEIGDFHRAFILRAHCAKDTAAKVLSFYKRYARDDKKEAKSVLLCGYYGFGNMGDDAMLVRAIQRANERFPHLCVRAMTANGKKDSAKFGVCCCRRYSISSLVREIQKSEAVIFGGGTLLQNSTSNRSLAYYLFILHFAQTRGKKTELWGNSVGNIKGKRWRAMTAEVLSECSDVGLRDRESVCLALELIQSNSLKMPCVRLEKDLAFAPFLCQRSRSEHILLTVGNKKTAVVVLKGGEKKEGLEDIIKCVSWLCRSGMTLVFVVMYPKEDLKLSLRVCKELGGVLAYPLGIADVTELIRSSCVVCSMRYHALVFARSVGIPFIGFGESEKIQRFCSSYGGIYADEKRG